MKNIETLKSIIKGSVKENEMMSKHTYYGIGWPADAYITPQDRNDLSTILQYADKNSIPAYFIGSGSNLLVSDKGINGLVLSPGKAFRNLKFRDCNVFAESGVMLGKVVRESIKRNLSGVESLIGVPGTLGGALVMNAGAFGGEISNYLQSVDVMNMKGEIVSYFLKILIFHIVFLHSKKMNLLFLLILFLEKKMQKLLRRKKIMQTEVVK